MNLSNKRGQLALFIIVALALVVVVLLFIFFRAGTDVIDTTPDDFGNPPRYVAECVEDVTKEAIDIMVRQGGSISPTLYKLYDSNRVEYLCYTTTFYEKCLDQKPFYVLHLENEIYDYILPMVDSCFNNLNEEYERRGYSPTSLSPDMEVEVDVIDGKVNIDIDREFSFTIKGNSERYTKFKSSFNSPLYRLARVAKEIVSQEARFCSFEFIGHMALYPHTRITSAEVSDETTIYILTDVSSGKELRIAVRSCASSFGILN